MSRERVEINWTGHVDCIRDQIAYVTLCDEHGTIYFGEMTEESWKTDDLKEGDRFSYIIATVDGVVADTLTKLPPANTSDEEYAAIDRLLDEQLPFGKVRNEDW